MEKLKIMFPEPMESKYIFHAKDSWNRICQDRDKDINHVDAFYIIRTLTANMKIESHYLQMNYYHEFFGHGGFVEHSQIGQRMQDYENELDCIESGSKQIKRGTKQYDNYTVLLNEYDNYCCKTFNIFEGYAYWLEHYITKENGLSEMSDIKKRFLEPNILELIVRFDKFVKDENVDKLIDVLFNARG